MSASLPTRNTAFTLIEMMVAMAVLILLLVLVVSVMNSVSTIVRRTSGSIDALAGARAGFDLLNRTAAQATLNTYWDYDDPLSPTVYLRESDLQFIIRQNTQNPGYGQELYFVAPETYASRTDLQSTSGLLNACSFFVQFGGSDKFRPASISAQRYRYRLMFGMQPTEKLSIFTKPTLSASQTTSAYRLLVQAYWDAKAWISPLANAGPSGLSASVAPLADNVIALIVWPRLPVTEDAAGTALSTDFQYDSQAGAFTLTQGKQPITAAQLPPVLQITLVAISETSAIRLDNGSGQPPAIIEQALQGKFTQVSSYQSDLDALGAALDRNHIEYKVFTTSVPLRESKWSKIR